MSWGRRSFGFGHRSGMANPSDISGNANVALHCGSCRILSHWTSTRHQAAHGTLKPLLQSKVRLVVGVEPQRAAVALYE